MNLFHQNSSICQYLIYMNEADLKNQNREEVTERELDIEGEPPKQLQINDSSIIEPNPTVSEQQKISHNKKQSKLGVVLPIIISLILLIVLLVVIFFSFQTLQEQTKQSSMTKNLKSNSKGNQKRIQKRQQIIPKLNIIQSNQTPIANSNKTVQTSQTKHIQLAQNPNQNKIPTKREIKYINNPNKTPSIEQKPIQYKSQEQYNKIRTQYYNKYEKYRLKQDKISQSLNTTSLWGKILSKHIQPTSQFHRGIKDTEEFKLLQREWESIIPFEEFKFEYDPALQEPQEKINISGYFVNNSIGGFLKRQSQKYASIPEGIAQTALDLAVALENSDNPLVRQAQYLLFDDIYKIGQPKNEIPMCILSNGYNIASKNRYNGYFDSIERLNYTNYHVVIIDDNSKDNSIQVFYDYLRNTTSKLKNRVSLIRSLLQVRSTTHLYYGAKHFCKQGEVIVNIDTDDKAIGYQTLKLLNVFYQDPQAWFVHGRFVLNLADRIWRMGTLNSPLKVKANQYRTTINLWATSHLKTYRQDIWKNAPIEYFIEYHYNTSTGYYDPIFIDQASDRPIIYYVVQVSGNERIRYIPFGLYYYYQWTPPKNKKYDCYIQHMYYEQYKIRSVTPLKKFQTINDIPQSVDNYKCPMKILKGLQVEYNKLLQCQRLAQAQRKQKGINN